MAATDRRFDLIVNDMRMTPLRSCDLMRLASQRLKPGGPAIMTLKLSPYHPFPTLAQAFSVLRQAYDILHARQLFHNRNEVTIVARRR